MKKRATIKRMREALRMLNQAEGRGPSDGSEKVEGERAGFVKQQYILVIVKSGCVFGLRKHDDMEECKEAFRAETGVSYDDYARRITERDSAEILGEVFQGSDIYLDQPDRTGYMFPLWAYR
ncbi:hypothetical protein ACTHPH_21625 [Paenibacillus pasadenensis]|uniref:hypothetical protein n=1 Tax=Paenibacillus pasadenensis TaxID=217090 RepID=UPI0003FBCF13|nr:hypothetical protein [Paenibacillus pasadenensis]